MADELLFLGLYDEGAPELHAALTQDKPPQSSQPFNGPAIGSAEQSSAGAAGAARETNAAQQTEKTASATARAPSLSPDAAYTLAVFYKRGEHADYAVRYAEPLWKKVPADFLLELAPREMLELLYPAPYADALRSSAPQRGVDPRFILAIARQESRFQPEAKSGAAARGLLQFIPSTAQAIAAQLGRNAASQDELYDPRTAVLYGAQYMGNLFKQFPGMPQAVAASYNGGEDNVARWVVRAKHKDPGIFTSEVGFNESKDYVNRVMANYRAYKILYTDDLKPR
jgi:soluble lytic murein transglycosylase